MHREFVAKTRQVFALLFLFIALPVAIHAQESTPGFYVFFKKPSDWQKVYLYTWYRVGPQLIETSGKWPGRPLSDVAGWYRGFIDQSQTDPNSRSIQLVFNDAAGQQTQDLVRSDNGWYVWKKGDQWIRQWYDLNPEERLFALTVEGGKGSGRYAPGSLVSVEAESQGAQNFLTWEGPDVGLLKDKSAKFTQLQMPDKNVSIVARYEDLSNGQREYEKQCKGCHGMSGAGGVGPSLLFDAGTCKSCGSDASLSDRIAKTMPVGAVGACKGSCAQSVARYIRAGLNQQSGQDCSQVQEQTGPRQLRLLTQQEYARSIRDVLGVNTVEALRFWPEPPLVQGYHNNAEANVATDRHVLMFAKAAREIASRTSIENRWAARCGRDTSCLVQEFGLRLFRRPLRESELSHWTKLWATHPRAGQAVLEGMLQAPAFLYRSEMGRFMSPSNSYALDSYEIAAVISYSLGGTTPDETLLNLAKEGQLSRAEVRRAQAERLLQTEGARETFAQFAVQWLGIGGLPFVTRDQSDFNAVIRRDMLEESQRYVNDIVFDKEAGVAEFFNGDRSFVSRALARYYGLPIPPQDWDSVDLGPQRQGILSLGAILANYGNSREASPIKRGVFVRNRLLCQDLPPPPANVDTTIPPPAPGLTIRERLEKHISQGKQSDGTNTCYSCHQYIDMVGFGFEMFDETAKLRFFYPEKPDTKIDISGELKSPEDFSNPATLPFQDLKELGGLLAKSQRSKQCFATQYLRFAQGRIEQSSDQCSLQSLQQGLVQGKSIKSFIADWVASPGFVTRRAQ